MSDNQEVLFTIDIPAIKRFMRKLPIIIEFFLCCMFWYLIGSNF